MNTINCQLTLQILGTEFSPLLENDPDIDLCVEQGNDFKVVCAANKPEKEKTIKNGTTVK